MLAIRQVTPAIGMLSGKGSTRKADEAIMAMRDDMSDEEHLGDKFMAMTVLDGQERFHDGRIEEQEVDRLAPSARSVPCGRSGNACLGTGSKHAKIVTHHEPEGHV